MNLDVVRLGVVMDMVMGDHHYIKGWVMDLMFHYVAHISHTHLFVQVLATPTSSNVSMDNVLMPHWRAIKYLIAVMEVMRLAAHVS